VGGVKTSSLKKVEPLKQLLASKKQQALIKKRLFVKNIAAVKEAQKKSLKKDAAAAEELHPPSAAAKKMSSVEPPPKQVEKKKMGRPPTKGALKGLLEKVTTEGGVLVAEEQEDKSVENLSSSKKGQLVKTQQLNVEAGSTVASLVYDVVPAPPEKAPPLKAAKLSTAEIFVYEVLPPRKCALAPKTAPHPMRVRTPKRSVKVESNGVKCSPASNSTDTAEPAAIDNTTEDTLVSKSCNTSHSMPVLTSTNGVKDCEPDTAVIETVRKTRSAALSAATLITQSPPPNKKSPGKLVPPKTVVSKASDFENVQQRHGGRGRKSGLVGMPELKDSREVDVVKTDTIVDLKDIMTSIEVKDMKAEVKDIKTLKTDDKTEGMRGLMWRGTDVVGVRGIHEDMKDEGLVRPVEREERVPELDNFSTGPQEVGLNGEVANAQKSTPNSKRKSRGSARGRASKVTRASRCHEMPALSEYPPPLVDALSETTESRSCSRVRSGDGLPVLQLEGSPERGANSDKGSPERGEYPRKCSRPESTRVRRTSSRREPHDYYVEKGTDTTLNGESLDASRRSYAGPTFITSTDYSDIERQYPPPPRYMRPEEMIAVGSESTSSSVSSSDASPGGTIQSSTDATSILGQPWSTHPCSTTTVEQSFVQSLSGLNPPPFQNTSPPSASSSASSPSYQCSSTAAGSIPINDLFIRYQNNREGHPSMTAPGGHSTSSSPYMSMSNQLISSQSNASAAVHPLQIQEPLSYPHPAAFAFPLALDPNSYTMNGGMPQPLAFWSNMSPFHLHAQPTRFGFVGGPLANNHLPPTYFGGMSMFGATSHTQYGGAGSLNLPSWCQPDTSSAAVQGSDWLMSQPRGDQYLGWPTVAPPPSQSSRSTRSSESAHSLVSTYYVNYIKNKL